MSLDVRLVFFSNNLAGIEGFYLKVLIFKKSFICECSGKGQKTFSKSFFLKLKTRYFHLSLHFYEFWGLVSVFVMFEGDRSVFVFNP